MADVRMQAKAQIRRNVREQLALLTVHDHKTVSHRARQLLEQQPEWQNANSIFVYAPLPGELDIWPLVRDSLAAEKVVCLPRFEAATRRYIACQVENLDSDIVAGRFGVREPMQRCTAVPLNRLDLILVPGVAFDTRGNRLGRGKGFYDQLLADTTGIRCGVAFDEQIVTEIPVEPHDIPMHCILTPTRWIRL